MRIYKKEKLISKSVKKESSISQDQITTILVRNGGVVSTFTLILYFLLQYFLHSGRNYCHSRIEYSDATGMVILLACILFSFGCFIQIVYLLSSGKKVGKKWSIYRSLNWTTLVINFIAGSSCFLTYSFRWGEACVDQFG